MSALLKLNQVTKTYGSRTILDRIDLTLDYGESLAITGPSGCGKSTLLNIVGLLESPSSGKIQIEKHPYPSVNSAKASAIRRELISYLFQSYALIQSKSALENVMLGMKYVDGSTKQKKAKALQMLSRLGLGHVANDKVVTLSGGEQQRVALARCVLKPGKLILADEPTGALDPHLANVVLKEILQLQHEFGKSLIVVTHNLKVAAACDRQLQLAVHQR